MTNKILSLAMDVNRTKLLLASPLLFLVVLTVVPGTKLSCRLLLLHNII
jgi:hypothetical protein